MAFAIPLIALSGPVASTATVALAAASAVSTLFAQRESVKAAQDAMDANAASASASAASQYRGLIVGQLREESATAQELDRIEREALSAESSAGLAATEAGAGGGVLRDQVRNFRAASLSYKTAVQRNLGFSRSDAALRLAATGEEAKGRISTYRPDYERPSYLGAALEFGQGFLDASRFGVPNRSANTRKPKGSYHGMPIY